MIINGKEKFKTPKGELKISKVFENTQAAEDNGYTYYCTSGAYFVMIKENKYKKYALIPKF